MNNGQQTARPFAPVNALRDGRQWCEQNSNRKLFVRSFLTVFSYSLCEWHTVLIGLISQIPAKIKEISLWHIDCANSHRRKI